MDAGLISLVGVALLVVVQLILVPMSKAFLNRLVDDLDRNRTEQAAINLRVSKTLDRVSERLTRLEALEEARG